MRQPSQHRRYLVVTPARDEANHLAGVIASMRAQTIAPVEWVIVDDGSSDGTAEVAATAASETAWISLVERADRGHREPGGGVVDAFDAGFGARRTDDWDYLVKLDADLTFDRGYFEECLLRFERDPSLGIAGGGVYHRDRGALVLERTPSFHVRGATKIYRRACWEAIGGLVPAPGWDTLDEVHASMLGWKTMTFPELRLLHHRRTGQATGQLRSWVKYGRAAYLIGYHPAFLAARAARRAFSPPYVVGAAALVWGYAEAARRREEKLASPELVAFVRRQQLRRLLGRPSIWR